MENQEKPNVQSETSVEADRHNAEAPDRLQRHGVGTSLKWDDSYGEFSFCLELPFWLLIPSGSYEIPVNDFSVRVKVENTGIEVQCGQQYTRSHRSTVFIGSQDSANRVAVPLSAVTEGGVFRATRTLLYVTATAIKDAFEAFFGGDGPRFQDGFRYFASLAKGHLPLVNKLVNAYRLASIDPYATEVTEWDVPVWFVQHKQSVEAVHLNAYLLEDWYPTIISGLESKEEIPYLAAQKDAIEKYLSSGPIPGEIEMLDGWSLFHRHRYGDSIRSFVTAIEVLVESEIVCMLKKQGLGENEISLRLESTRNNFDSRIKQYCSVSGRRIPGPILHQVPYINGVRLLEEIERTRLLRHRIVHHGHRLDHSFAKPMLRAAETTSWLFDWIADHGDFEARRGKNSTYFFGTRINSTPFDTTIRDGHIVVEPPAWFGAGDDGEVDQISQPVVRMGHVVYSDEVLLRTISPLTSDGKDVEHFIKMALFELGLGEVEDTPYEIDEPAIAERFRTSWQGRNISIFILDSSDQVSRDHIDEVIRQIANKRDNGSQIDRALLIANDQMHQVWSRRLPAASKDLTSHAESNLVSVITTPDLARLTLGVLDYSWNSKLIIDEILEAGIHAAVPPSSKCIGSVYHFWGEPKVVGVQLAAHFTVQDGDILAIALPNRMKQFVVGGAKIDSERRLTFRVDLERNEVPVESLVYLLDAVQSFQREPEPSEDAGGLAKQGISRAFLLRAVPPTKSGG